MGQYDHFFKGLK